LLYLVHYLFSPCIHSVPGEELCRSMHVQLHFIVTCDVYSSVIPSHWTQVIVLHFPVHRNHIWGCRLMELAVANWSVYCWWSVYIWFNAISTKSIKWNPQFQEDYAIPLSIWKWKLNPPPIFTNQILNDVQFRKMISSHCWNGR